MTPLRVELLGLPGAGKTTVTERVRASLRAAGVRTLGRAEIQGAVGERLRSEGALWRGLRLVRHEVEHARLLAHGLDLSRRARPARWQGFYRAYCLTRHLQTHDLAAEVCPPVDAWILDQDLLQEVWGVLYLRVCPDLASLDRVLTSLRPRASDMIVHARLDARVALERIAARRALHGPLGDVDTMTDLSAAELARAGEQLTLIHERAGALWPTQSMSVDGSLAPERIAREITAAVLERMGRAPATTSTEMESHDE